MEWEFTPDQVVKAEVDYGLREFRRDLLEEVRLNVPGLPATQTRHLFDLLYDLCYWLATGKELDEFVDGIDAASWQRPFVIAMSRQCDRNVEMLGAILQRMIMDRVEGGAALDDALALVAQEQQRIAAADLFELAA
jgi:hypothetical protein